MWVWKIMAHAIQKHHHRLPVFERKAEKNDKKLSQFLSGIFGACFKKELVEILYLFLSAFAYGYLFLIVADFFFGDSMPHFLMRLADALSEPYLGALSVYFAVREIMRRGGAASQWHVGELFFIGWIMLFVVASVLTFFSDSYYFDSTYNLIMKNSLAALILRVGLFFR